MLNKYRADKTDINRVNMVKARTDFKSEVRNFKQEIDRANTKKLVDAKYRNAKEYWKLLKNAANITTCTSKSLSVNNFTEYFKAINNPDNAFFQPDEEVIYFNERFLNSEIQVMFSELDIEITREEILQSIKQLKNGKSGGPDQLLNEFFIHGQHVLLPCLHILFNKLLTLGYFPSSWAEGHIVPLHKKGDVNNVNNYRGITLLSVLGKLFTRLLNNRLKEWAEMYQVYIEAQAGFRKCMSTADNIFVLHGLISHMLNAGKKFYCAFIDFSKAFDYVVRDVLWYKLIKLGVRGQILKVIKSMYESIKSRVKCNNELSEEFTCCLGVRQGECLSPFLFAMYVNDIEDYFYVNGAEGVDTYMFKLFLLLYADDITLFSETAQGLQKGLDILKDYCNKWKLMVNTEKSKIIVFRKGGQLARNLKFYYDGLELSIVGSFSYLGVVFTPGGSFSLAQNTLSGQAQKAIFRLNSYLYKFTEISPYHRLELFDKLVAPILNYAAEVWVFCKADKIEVVHLQFCKRLLGLKQCTQNDFIYGELGRVSFQNKRFFIIIKYWLKIILCNENKLIKHVYNMMLQDIDTMANKENWALLVKKLLGSLGFNEVWMAQGVGDVNVFLNLVNQRLQDNFLQNWNSRLADSSRAAFYTCINSFQYQHYLNFVKVRKYRQALSRLRCSSHRLEIESGRWHKPVRTPIENRKCKQCNTVENEFHLLFECPLYNELRSQYLDSYFYVHPNQFKLKQLFQSTQVKQVIDLSIFMYKAFALRNSVLY